MLTLILRFTIVSVEVRSDIVGGKKEFLYGKHFALMHPNLSELTARVLVLTSVR